MDVRSTIRRAALGFASVLALVATIGAAATAHEEAIYRFTDVADGFGPRGLVADDEGDLYGTTYLGGPNTNCYQGCGTVFELSPPSTPGGKWTKTTIHAFDSDGVDGYQPTPSILIDEFGNIFGTTYFGGASNAGVVYELVPPIEQNEPWNEYIVFSFQYGGTNPNIGGALLQIASGFYATTFAGGSAGGGTLLQLTQRHGSFGESVLHSFDLQRNTRPPGRDLILDGAGNIYGIRFGMNGVCTSDFPLYCGTVYRFKPSTPGGTAKYEVLHRFEGSTDGWFPNDELTFDGHGDLFGTTSAGGGATQGIVFELVPNKIGKPWAEQIVFSFGFGGDYKPLGGVVIGPRGSLFGTTSGSTDDAGTVYRLTPPPMLGGAWTESTLYRFGGGTDGAQPNDQLVFGHDGALYGTTYAGGIGPCTYYGTGCGVVFRVSPR